MAKTQAYYSGKALNNNALVTAEESYMAVMKNIFRVYSSKRDRKTMVSRWNEHQTNDYNPNWYSTRKTEGNPS